MNNFIEITCENLGVIDILLKKYSLFKKTQNRENIWMNILTIKKIKFIIKTFPQRKVQMQWLVIKLYQMFSNK